MGEKSVRSSSESAAEIGGHRFDYVLLPEKAVAAAGSKVGDGQTGHAAQALDLAPKGRLGAGVKDVEIELAQFFHVRSRAQFVEDGERIEFPHGGFRPRTVEGQTELAVLHS